MNGKNAAVRTLRGTGKHAGTCVMSASGTGDLLPFVIIYKHKTKFDKKESEAYEKLEHVRVVKSKSSYINEDIWSKEVIGGVMYEYLRKTFGEYWADCKSLVLSDGHASHFTMAVLVECAHNSIFPALPRPIVCVSASQLMI